MYLTNLALHMIYNIILIEISLMYIHKNIDDQPFIHILGLKKQEHTANKFICKSVQIIEFTKTPS